MSKRKLRATTRKWRRRVKRWMRRHGIEGAIARIERRAPAPGHLESWDELVSARRAGRVAAELIPDDQPVQALTQFAVLRSLRCPAAIRAHGGSYVVSVHDAVVSPQAKTFRAPEHASSERSTVDEALTDLG